MNLRRWQRAPYAPSMSDGPDLEARVTALETQMVQVTADAAAARHLAAANDHDLSSLSVKVDAHRPAINALGVQTAARFDKLESEVHAGFAEIRGRLDQTTAGLQQIVTLLTDEGPAVQ